jgi:hypothetical protein
LGALLVGYYEKKDFVYAGKLGTGFDTKLLLGLRTRLDAIEIPESPFTKAVGLPRLRAHWVRPSIVVQVGFIEWTKFGKLRHPLISRPPQRQVRARRRAGGALITHPNKVLFPNNGLNEKDAAVIRFGRELFHDKKIDSAAFAKAVELWGKRGTMDMWL